MINAEIERNYLGKYDVNYDKKTRCVDHHMTKNESLYEDLIQLYNIDINSPRYIYNKKIYKFRYIRFIFYISKWYKYIKKFKFEEIINNKLFKYKWI